MLQAALTCEESLICNVEFVRFVNYFRRYWILVTLILYQSSLGFVGSRGFKKIDFALYPPDGLRGVGFCRSNLLSITLTHQRT